MPSTGVSARGVEDVDCHSLYPYRVTSHVKAMEDAVEIGLRSAFNEVGLASFGKVLPGMKLRGKRLNFVRHQANFLYAPLLAGKQALSYYFTDELREFLEAALRWHNAHNRAEITPFLKEYGERLKARREVSLRLVSSLDLQDRPRHAAMSNITARRSVLCLGKEAT